MTGSGCIDRARCPTTSWLLVWRRPTSFWRLTSTVSRAGARRSWQHFSTLYQLLARTAPQRIISSAARPRQCGWSLSAIESLLRRPFQRLRSTPICGQPWARQPGAFTKSNSAGPCWPDGYAGACWALATRGFSKLRRTGWGPQVDADAEGSHHGALWGAAGRRWKHAL